MKEIHEFRLFGDFAAGKLPDVPAWTTGYGLVRVVKVEPHDPLFAEIGRLDREARSRGTFLFSAWNVRRFYSEEELAAAAFLRARVLRVFEPAGEECGTVYDEEGACPVCRSGAPQVGPLILRASALPKKLDIARTIAGEVVVSEATRRLFEEEQMTGAELAPLQCRSRGRLEPNPDFHQLLIAGSHPVIDAQSNVGVDPFIKSTPDTEPCPKGDLLGLNLASELWLRADTVPEQDVMTTRQYIGVRSGLLRPERVIVISRRLATLIEERGLKGFRFEVVHLVE